MKRLVGLASAVIAGLLVSVLFFSCDSNDPTEAVSFSPGLYNGVYKTITNYSRAPIYQETAVDSVTFDFQDTSPSNVMFMRLDANRDSERDHCDWDCTWVLYTDSMKIDTSDNQPNTGICDHQLSPKGTYNHPISFIYRYSG